MAMRAAKHYTELMKQGRLVEEDGELEKAALLYEQAIRQEPLEAFPYNRLMIIYRKLRQPKDELRVIEKALAVYEHYYDEKPKKIMNGNPQIAKISKALVSSLNKSAGTKNLSYYPEPIPSWTRRKNAVEKKLGK